MKLRRWAPCSAIPLRARAMLLLVAVCTLLAAACTKMPKSPAEEEEADNKTHIWVTHCEGPAFRDVTKSPTYGGYPTGLIAKVSDRLILAMPSNAAPTYYGHDPASTHCAMPEDLPENALVGFTIVLSPSGYDATTPIRESRAQDRVSVMVSNGTTVYPAQYERRYVQDPFKEVYGLRCYAGGLSPCFGNILPGDSPDIFVVSSWSTTGRIGAEYVSTDYPGVGIRWEIPQENLPRWKEIATQVAERLRDWNTLRQVHSPEGGDAVAPQSQR